MPKKYLSSFLIILSLFILAGCTSNKKTSQNNISSEATSSVPQTKSQTAQFSGNKGEVITIENNQLEIDSKLLEDGTAQFYNTTLNGKTIYFFVVKDKNGVYRAAANGCQVCYEAMQGFTQEGNYMKCNTCGNKYPLEKIATEKGGCNPVPINPDLEVKNSKVIITQSDLEQIIDFF